MTPATDDAAPVTRVWSRKRTSTAMTPATDDAAPVSRVSSRKRTSTAMMPATDDAALDYAVHCELSGDDSLNKLVDESTHDESVPAEVDSSLSFDLSDPLHQNAEDDGPLNVTSGLGHTAESATGKPVHIANICVPIYTKYPICIYTLTEESPTYLFAYLLTGVLPIESADQALGEVKNGMITHVLLATNADLPAAIDSADFTLSRKVILVQDARSLDGVNISIDPKATFREVLADDNNNILMDIYCESTVSPALSCFVRHIQLFTVFAQKKIKTILIEICIFFA
jgi:hypothetical protein